MNEVSITKSKSKRIFYFDALRALAIIAVILFHIFLMTRKGMYSQYAGPSFSWWVEDILGSCSKFGVDLFLMLSGALSLGREWDIKSFLGKRIPRITLPFVFWGVVLSCIIVLLCFYFPSEYHLVKSFTLFDILNFMKDNFLSLTDPFDQYWFFWMILGTYLSMPIFNKWLLHADLKEAEYFLVIWLITCLFSHTLGFDFPVKLQYFSGPIGCVVLGYYLRHTERKLFNNPYFSIAAFIVSIVILVFTSYMLSDIHHIKFFERYSILVVFEVFSIFLVFKNIGKLGIKSRILNNPDGVFRKLIFAIAKYSYGIYLVHEFIIKVLLLKIFKHAPFKLALLGYFIGALFGSLIILALLNRIPYINQVIGAK